MIDEGSVLDMKRPALACGDPHGYRLGIHGSYCERFVPGGIELLANLEVLDYRVFAFAAHGPWSDGGMYNKFALGFDICVHRETLISETWMGRILRTSCAVGRIMRLRAG